MKLCFVISYIGVGGVGTVFLNVLDALLKYTDSKITIYFHNWPTESLYLDWLKVNPSVEAKIYYPAADKFEALKVKYNFWPMKLLRKIAFSIYKKIRNHKIAKQIMKDKYDAIIDFVSGESYKQIKCIKNITKITWVHCSVDFVKQHNLIERLSNYDKIVCLTNAGISEFADVWPEHSDKLVQIYNSINYKEIEQQSHILPTYEGQYFLCVGRLDHDKDIPTVIRAFENFYIRENKPDVKMIFIGSGDIEEKMRKMALETEARHNFVFLGRIVKPYGYMRGAIACVLSSFNEGFGQVLVESMASGTINISSNCPNGPSEILLGGKAGLLFAPGDSEELSQKMSDVYCSKIKTKQIVHKATESLSRFAPETISNEIIKMIKGKRSAGLCN